MRAVGYNGSSALAEDVASGSMPSGVTVALSADDVGRYPRLLAVAGESRLVPLPDVPTLREAGFAVDFPRESLGCFMSSSSPEVKIQQLATAISHALHTRATSDAMVSAAFTPMTESSRSYAQTIAAERI